MTHKLLPSLFIIGCIFSCTINDSDFQIKGVQSDPTLVLPLASGDLSILDILKKQDSSKIKAYSDGTVYLDYDTILVSKQLRDTVDIPNIGTKTFGLSVPAQTYKANKGDIVSSTSTQSVNMGISPQKLTEIRFKSGTLSCQVTLNPAVPNLKYAALIEVPEFISNATNQQFSKSVTQDSVIQLPGYTLKTGTPNTFNLKVTLIIKNLSQQVTVNAGTTLTVKIHFDGMDFTYIRGFFGDQTVTPPPQSIPVQAFGTSFQNGATVSFANPTIDLSVINDYVVPLKVTFSPLEAKKTGAAIAMQTSPASPITITSPATLGTSAITPVSISNVNQVIDFAPTSFYYKVSGHINAGLVSGNSDFMADTSKMRVRMHVQIPLWGKASHIILYDTLDVGLGDADQSKIDSASMKASVVNELPLDANLQFILTDDKYVFIDSLLTASQTGIIKGSSVDSNGNLVTAGVVNKLIHLQTDKISKIFKAKKIIVKARMNTSKNASGAAVDVKFKKQYKIKVKLGLRATVKLKTTF